MDDSLKFVDGLWTLEWAEISRDHSVHTDRRMDGETDMARTTRLVILTKNIYTLCPEYNIPFYSTINGYKKLCTEP